MAAGRGLLKKIGIRHTVDMLGVSWGGALAQQFAFQHPHRCRRLVLVSTGTGLMMVPGRPRVLAKMVTPAVWTSIFALPLIRQQTLVIAGLDDPIVPLVNARIMDRLLPHSTLHPHAGGHVDLMANAAELGPVIEMFRNMA